jgi:excisionase family DNA binding protein
MFVHHKKILSAINSVATSVAVPSQPNLPACRGLRIQDAAKYLSVTACFIRALIATGEIPFIVAGKRHILDRHDLDAWLEARKQKVQQEVRAA